jgi:hypothetical protein
MGWDGMRPGVEMSSRDVSNFVNGSEQTKQSFGKKEICTSQISAKTVAVLYSLTS